MITNEDRAEKALGALMVYSGDANLSGEELVINFLPDLIADLLHLAHQNGNDALSLCNSAIHNFKEELHDTAGT